MKLLNKFIDLFQSIYFNFHYLPFKQAVKLPIVCHGVQFLDMKGCILINSDKIYRGMIHLGCEGVYIFYPHRGFSWQNHGGTVIFNGSCKIGAGGSVSVNSKATLSLGEDTINSYGLKIIASRNVTIGNHCRLGWNVLVMDTNMHPLKNLITHKKSKGGADVVIGDYNWISTEVVVLPGVRTPERVIIGLRSVVARNVELHPYCMYGGTPLKLLNENVYRDYDDDKDNEVDFLT